LLGGLRAQGPESKKQFYGLENQGTKVKGRNSKTTAVSMENAYKFVL